MASWWGGGGAAAVEAPKPEKVESSLVTEVPSEAVESTQIESDHSDEEHEEHEEVEVLPYDSVFDWTLQDPVGYYREHERYTRLCKQYSGDPIKVTIIKDMWADRKKYHVLRRFLWPPKQFLKLFYSRGYYDDYEARPTVELHWVSDTKVPENHKHDDIYLRTRVILLDEVNGYDLARGEFREARPENPQIIKVDGENAAALQEGPFHRREWHEYDPREYDKTKLEIAEVPEDTNEFTLVNIYPLANKVRLQKPHPITGKQQALLHYDTEPLAESDFNKSQNIDINGLSLAVAPRKLGIPDDDDEDKAARKKKKKSEYDTVVHPPPAAAPAEIVSYEVVSGPKKKKKKRPSPTIEEPPPELATETVETVSYEVVKKKKKKKKKGSE